MGYIPDKKRLFTDAAKNPKLIENTTRKSFVVFVPKLIKDEWGIRFDLKPDENDIEYRKSILESFMERL